MCKIDILLFGNIPNNNCAFFIISSSFYCIKLSIFCFGTANADYVLIWIMLHKYGTGSGYLGLKAFTLFLLAWWVIFIIRAIYFLGSLSQFSKMIWNETIPCTKHREYILYIIRSPSLFHCRRWMKNIF